MERLAIYVNDAPYAHRVLQPLLAERGDTPCTMVLCPPMLTHRVGKWLSNRQRQHWQRTWAERLRQDLQGLLPAAAGPQIEWTTASSGRPQDTTSQLRRRLGTGLQVMDLRKPRVGQNLPQLAPGEAAPGDDRWKAPLAVGSSLAVVLALID